MKGNALKTPKTSIEVSEPLSVSSRRYSDEDLEEFRQIIEEKLIKADGLLKNLKGSTTNQNGTSDTGHKSNPSDDAQEAQVKEVTLILASKQEKYISDLKSALIRIGNKTYGIDKDTNDLIPKDRLRLAPHTTHSANAKEERDKKLNIGGKTPNYHHLY